MARIWQEFVENTIETRVWSAFRTGGRQIHGGNEIQQALEGVRP